MPAQLMRPEVLLLIVFVLWGIAGKLDEPLEGFDPEPVQAEAAATEGGAAAQSLHLLCVVEEAGPGSVRQVAGRRVGVSPLMPYSIKPSTRPLKPSITTGSRGTVANTRIGWSPSTMRGCCRAGPARLAAAIRDRLAPVTRRMNRDRRRWTGMLP